ncbi:hypothetical protein CLFE_046780 (plasmid) [Clostridium felsineum DSM 794]|nr:hypothetical protein CLFE_046780 [Clostridium felsineum DSM 794]
MEIEISNKEDLITQRIQIKILKLKPNSKLKITLKTELPWCLGEEYSSYGVFLSTEKGEVDLALAKPIDGTYENADSMGLIYSLRKSKTQCKNIAENISIEKPMVMNMTFEASGEKETIILKRLFKTEDVIVKNINEKDFAGKLFFKGKAKKQF